MSDRASVLAEVSEQGLLCIHERDRWDSLVRAHKGKLIVLSLELSRNKRSSQANRRYFGVVVPVCAQILSRGRALPLSKEQTHWLLKSAFLGSEETPLGLVPKDSHTLSTEEFSEYTERIEAHFRAEFGAVFEESES